MEMKQVASGLMRKRAELAAAIAFSLAIPAGVDALTRIGASPYSNGNR